MCTYFASNVCVLQGAALTLLIALNSQHKNDFDCNFSFEANKIVIDNKTKQNVEIENVILHLFSSKITHLKCSLLNREHCDEAIKSLVITNQTIFYVNP